MISFVRTLVARIDDGVVDRWPLFVYFRLVVILPVASAICLLGVAAAIAAPTPRPLVDAAGVIPARYVADYNASVSVARRECARMVPATQPCGKATGSQFVGALNGLSGIARRAGLSDCQRLSIVPGKSRNAILLVCRGKVQLTFVTTSLWISAAIAAVGQSMFVTSVTSSARRHIPRFSPRLWITVPAHLAAGAALLPLAAVIAVFVFHANARVPRVHAGVTDIFLLFLLCTGTFALLIVVDLHTFAADRIYGRAVSVSLATVLATVVLLLSASVPLGDRYPAQSGWIVLGDFVLAIMVSVLLLRRLSRLDSGRSAYAARRYLLRGLVLSPFLILAWLLYLARFSLSIGHVTAGTIGLLCLNILYSYAVETRQFEPIRGL